MPLSDRFGSAIAISAISLLLSFGGNKTTGFVYSSDHKDISAKPSANSPYLEVKKLKDHWFWQVEGI